MEALAIRDLSVSYKGKKVFEGVTFSVTTGQLVGIIGPNGAGKSTLLKAVLGLAPADRGEIRVLTSPLSRKRKSIAYVPQRSSLNLDFPLLVEDLVMMGRYPHISWWGFPSPRDTEVVMESLKKVGMYSFRRRQIGKLSGGQQQRVFLARALAQEAELLFLDEPFAGIDITSENMIIILLRELKEEGKTVFLVHHDLHKAESYFDSFILLKNRLVAWGSREEVFRIDCLREAYEGRIASLDSLNGMMVVNG
ncbi:MAG: metal ABC transporter ATP-binding protein [Candidatus Syntrophonatronum acetioxidans]|uniref:Metal ABC transporter ATP-binding protein n=1 Tax=Candidatus Syntrophonatronum acetioxidans TaxID=1795816 RepID=A0A424YHC3_9FIRM|nr:MAG: metal ABC transporter ATP-binding protein [Candidatus Syntrophonatronum acetioxidans]